MRFIENNDLREWVKDSLRKTIFQKAHALAVQTGCEVLVKLQDVTDAAGCQYYATSTLKQAYKMSNLRQPGEMAVSGETGMPTFPMVDRAIQSGDDSNTGFASSLAAEGDEDDDGGGQGELNGDEQNTPVPMQLSMAGGDQGTEHRTHSEQGSQPPTPSEQQTANVGLGMPMIKSEPGSDLMDLIGLIPGSGDAGGVNVKQEPPGEDRSSDGTISYGDSDDIIDVTPAQQQAQQQAQQAAQMQLMFQQQQQAAAAAQMQSPLGSPTSTASPFAASAQMQAFSQNLPASAAAQGSPSGAPQRYQVPMAPKPYQCATCQKAFGSIQLLQKHTQTFHMRAQNVMSQKTRGRGRGSSSRGRGGQQRWPQSQSPSRFGSPGMQAQLSPQQQQQKWLEQAGAITSSPSGMPQQMAQVQGGGSPSQVSPYGQHSPGSFPSPGAGPSRASPQARRQLMGSSPSRASRKSGFDRRLTHATNKNIKMAILLSPGPVANHLTTRSMSSSFKIAVTKPKFMAAARQLQDEGMGSLVVLDRRGTDVFVKLHPAGEIQNLLQAFGDVFTAEEYEHQYGLAPFSYITLAMQESLVQGGYVRAEDFKVQTLQRRIRAPKDEVVPSSLS